MSRLATLAEIDKLGATLAVEPAQLDFLRPVPAEQLRGLRIAIYEQMFEDERELFRRLGRISRRLPSRLLLPVAQLTGPLITARVLAEVPSERAARVAAGAPTGFLADVCVHLDPRRTHDVLRRLPAERVVDIAHELRRRRDYMTMSRFVEYFPDEVTRDVVDTIEDEGDIMRIAFYIGSKSRLDHLLQLLPADRLERLLVRVEEQAEELLSPFLSLLIHVSYRLKRQLGDLVAAQDETRVNGLISAIDEQELWADVLPVVAAMSPDAKEVVVNRSLLRERGVQESVIAAADDNGLWGILLPLIELMDESGREAVAQIVAQSDRATLTRATDAALMGEHWELLLDLVGRMPAPKQAELAALVRELGEVDPELRARIERQAAERGLALSG